MPKFRFIHTADLHLGSFLHISQNDLTEDVLNKIANATYEAFKRICDAAVELKVDFILISGDLYDREARSVKANGFFASQCGILNEQGIKVFVIAGNHDPLSEQKNELFDLPSNVKIFSSDSPETEIVKNKNGIAVARIIGQSYKYREESRKMHLDYAVPKDDLCNIALLHSQLDSNNSSYVPCSLSELTKIKNIHYWALGHIHKNVILNNSDPAVAYSGIPQGRDTGETGPGYFMLVEMDRTKAVSIEPVQVSPLIWESIEIRMEEGEEAENISDLEKMILNKAQELAERSSAEEARKAEGYITEWVIRGKSKIHELLSERIDETAAELTEKLNKRLLRKKPFILTEKIKIITQKWQSDEDLKNKPMYGEIIKEASEFSRDDIKKSMLQGRLKNIWEFCADHESADESMLQMSEELYREIIERAKMLILENLPEGSDSI